MSERLQRLIRGGLYLGRGTLKAARVGRLFPASSRRRPRSAPGGSTESPLRASRAELGRFTLSRHRLPVSGLERPVRLLQISDTHVRGGGAWLEALVDVLEGLPVAGVRFDAVLLTGDIVTKDWTEEAAGRLLGALPDAPLGRYAVMGNWEHWAGASPGRWGALLGRYGVRLLLNEGVDLGPVGLAGVDDYLAGRADIEAALDGLPRKPSVLLSHSPGLFPALARPPVRLVLSGHAHGGQIRLPGLGSFFVPRGTERYVAGWFARGDVQLFVSRGVGWSLAPLRWRCPPELVEILLLPG